MSSSLVDIDTTIRGHWTIRMASLVIATVMLLLAGCNSSNEPQQAQGEASAPVVPSVQQRSPDESSSLNTMTVSLDTLDRELKAKGEQLTVVHLWATW